MPLTALAPRSVLSAASGAASSAALPRAAAAAPASSASATAATASTLAAAPAAAAAAVVPAVSSLMTPMSREEYERENSRVRQVFDPLTGRVRLVRGAGEILEQIVPRHEQQRLKQLATRWDGRLMYGAPGER